MIHYHCSRGTFTTIFSIFAQAKFRTMDLSYIINLLGEEIVGDMSAVSPPLYMTSNYRYSSVEAFRKAISNERESLIYSRGNNQTINLLCRKLAALEGADECLVFGSGMAAISAAILSQVSSGDHIVCQQHPYSWTNTFLNSNILPRFGVAVTMAEGADSENIIKAFRPETRVIYLESPNSWTFGLQDIEAIVLIARQRGIITILDNSFSTPLYQQPIKMGVDLVVHSASKYLGGHSDLVGGVCCGSKKLIDSIFRNEFMTLGGIMSPFAAWLFLRGLRTLPLRMEHISKSTRQIVNYLENHPKISKIYYPFASGNPQKELAEKLIVKGSGLFSIETVTNDTSAIESFCNKLKYFSLAVSWGGHESLVIPAFIFSDSGQPTYLNDNMIRFSIGLEETEVLIADLDNALREL
jgi:cystathionine beta-lyase/cystathionine gamma-synthase